MPFWVIDSKEHQTVGFAILGSASQVDTTMALVMVTADAAIAIAVAVAGVFTVIVSATGRQVLSVAAQSRS